MVSLGIINFDYLWFTSQRRGNKDITGTDKIFFFLAITALSVILAVT